MSASLEVYKDNGNLIFKEGMIPLKYVGKATTSSFTFPRGTYNGSPVITAMRRTSSRLDTGHVEYYFQFQPSDPSFGLTLLDAGGNPYSLVNFDPPRIVGHRDFTPPRYNNPNWQSRYFGGFPNGTYAVILSSLTRIGFAHQNFGNASYAGALFPVVGSNGFTIDASRSWDYMSQYKDKAYQVDYPVGTFRATLVDVAGL